MNGNPKCTKFDAFWNELEEYLEEITTAVNERTQVDVMHIPLAISIRHLQDLITNRLQTKKHNYATNSFCRMDKTAILAI